MSPHGGASLYQSFPPAKARVLCCLLDKLEFVDTPKPSRSLCVAAAGVGGGRVPWVWCCGHRPQSGDTYGLGETLTAEVIFSKAVTVTGTPQLTLTIGSATRTVDLDSVWDDGEGLVFEYEVQSDDLDTDGISIAAAALSLNGATIQDRGGNPADLDLSEHAIVNDDNLKVDGSIDRPPVVEWAGVDSEPQSGDTYAIGEEITIDVNFNELVTVTGTPQLELTIGTATRTVDLEGTCCDDTVLVFRYKVQAADRDSDGISVVADALKLNGATIQDRGGNDADLDLSEHAFSNDGDHKVDGSIDHPPVVIDLWCCGHRPQSGDTYGLGETLKAEVIFNEAVTVTGTPQLTLTIAWATRTVDLEYVWDDGEGLVFTSRHRSASSSALNAIAVTNACGASPGFPAAQVPGGGSSGASHGPRHHPARNSAPPPPTPAEFLGDGAI